MGAGALLAGAAPYRAGFAVTDGERTLAEVAPADFSAHAGQLAFWSLGNDLLAVRRFFDALAAGVVPVLVPPRTPAHKLAALREEHPAFGFFDGETLAPAARPTTSDPRVALAVMTSGSTGTPKLVAASLDSLAAGVSAIGAAQGLADVASTGVMLPLAYSFAFVNQLLWALFEGRRLVLLPGMLDPGRSFELMAAERVEMLCLVANQVRSLEELGFGGDDAVATVKVVNFAGGPFPIAGLPTIRALFPAARLFNNYGCTEAMPRLTVAEVKGDDHPVTRVGRPIDGVELRLDGDGAVGSIEFRAPSASIGLLDASGTLLPHGAWLASGDLGRLEDGELHVLGRHDQVVKLGGERVSLIEIEQALQSGALSDAVAWMENNEPAPELLAVVTGRVAPSHVELSRLLRERLPRPMWPARLFWQAEWPLLPNGKTDRLCLQELVRGGRLAQLYPPIAS